MLGLPPTAVKSLAALTAGVARGDVALHHAVPRAGLLASLTMVPGIEPATAHQIAFRLGHREPVPGLAEDQDRRPAMTTTRQGRAGK